MKFKTTLILLAVAGALFVFIQFYESHIDPTPVTDLRKKHPALFDAETITGMEITNNESKIDFHFQDNTWRMVSPVNDRANLGLVHDIVSNLHDLEVVDSFEAGGKNGSTPSLSDLGLETPGIRVKLSGPGAPAEYLIGKDTPVEGRMYMRLDGSNTVWVISNALKAELQKKTDEFRDHKLLAVAPQQINRLDIKSPAGEIEVLRDQSTWLVDKPLRARADGKNIFRLTVQAINMEIDSFVPDSGADLATYGLAEPRGSITLMADGSDTPAVLEIGQPLENDKTKVYAKLSTRESILVLPEKINDILFIKPNEVRDKSLMELNLDMVDRIHIDAAGKPKLTIARKGEDWVLKSYSDQPANNNLVKACVAYLSSPLITSFASDVATDLPKYGLDKPQLRITFSSYASENTAETTAGEDTILSVAFGKAEGNMVYARLESEPYIVAIPLWMPDGRTIFDAISADPVYWEDISIYKYKPEEIASLEITRDGKTIALERTGTAPWKLKEGEGGFNQVAVESLVNALAPLRAVRWVGSSTAGLGFDKPPLTISFTTTGKQSGKLTIGSQNEELMWNAEALGHTGAFMISDPDYEVLDGVLTAPVDSGK